MPRALCLVLVFLVGGVVHAAPTDDDRDGDGILNHVDLCPDDPEDQDGFEDQDGCPDPDNDKDRIPDAVDMCPNEPETYNGYQDKDGCPDKLITHYVGSPDAILDRIYFLRGSAIIKAVSMPILDQLAAALKANPSVVSATSVGHASRDEHDAAALSLARAQAVMAYLVKKGVAAKRLHAVGKGTAADPSAPTGTDPSIHRVVHFDMVRGDPGKQ
jgi:outer membrane protein OmpA-like peptidoglycan-associated protein